jgi:predicted PurR-regulated permease PerM
VNASTSTTSTLAATRYILIAIALLAVAVVIWRVADVLVVGFGGIVLAALLRALANPLAHKTGWPSRRCVLIVVAALVLAAALLGWLFGHQAATQASELGTRLPEAGHQLLERVRRTDVGRNAVDSVREALKDSKTLSNVGIAAGAILGGVLNLLLILFLSVYFALDPAVYRDGALRLVPPRHRDRVGRALDDAGEALEKWLVAQALAMISVGLLVGLGLALIGVPLPFALGALAALLEFVPVLGPILFSLPGLLLALSKSPQTALYALIVYIVVQQLESNVLIPLLQRWAVKLPPVVGLLAIVAGGILLGITGVIFATPLAVVGMRLVQHLYVEETLEHRKTPPPSRARAAPM